MKNRRGIPTLLCFLLVTLCLLGAVGCGEKPCTHTDLAEHASVEPDCTHAGHPLYYTCNACGAVLDAGKQVIEAEPTTPALGHDYEEHAAVGATCTEDGTLKYFTCRRCERLFDADKRGIANVPVIAADGHAYAWVMTEVGDTATLTCAACGDEHTTVRLSLAESARFLVDADRLADVTVRYDLSGYGEGITVTAVKYGGTTVTNLTVEGGFVTFPASALLAGTRMGKFDITLSLAADGIDATVDATAPVTLAKIIDGVEDLLALRPTLTDGAATLTGGRLEEISGKTVIIPDYYVLTADIDGRDRLGNASVYAEGITDAGDTSGRAKEGFVGILDGQGHTVSGFSMLCRGIFGHIGQATVRDITFSDITLDSPVATVFGKTMDTTFINVNVKNITTTTARDGNSGILFYHQVFSVTIDGMTVDLTGGTVAGHVFARYLANDDGDFGPCEFRGVTVRTSYSAGLDLFEGVALTNAPTGVTVNLIIGDDPDAGKWGEFLPTPAP